MKPPIDITATAFISSGAVFNEKTRWHAHSFIAKFERYARNADLNETQMCTTFLQCIKLQGTESWKEQRQHISSFTELKKEFLDEFWSTLIQKHVKSMFETIKIRATSARIFIGELRMWIETLKTADNPDMKDIINTACEKLPQYLASKVSADDKASEAAFFRKLKLLETDTKNPNITRGVIEPDLSLPSSNDWPLSSVPPKEILQKDKKSDKNTSNPKISAPTKPPGIKTIPVKQVSYQEEKSSDFAEKTADENTRTATPPPTVEDANESTDSLNA